MASLVLGSIGLLFFFFPVLGIPFSAFGLFFGVLGCFAARSAGGARLRWTLAGIAISSVALAVNIAIVYAPAGYLPGPKVPELWQTPPDRPNVPPPAP
jgi:hypothetical protein